MCANAETSPKVQNHISSKLSCWPVRRVNSAPERNIEKETRPTERENFSFFLVSPGHAFRMLLRKKRKMVRREWVQAARSMNEGRFIDLRKGSETRRKKRVWGAAPARRRGTPDARGLSLLETPPRPLLLLLQYGTLTHIPACAPSTQVNTHFSHLRARVQRSLRACQDFCAYSPAHAKKASLFTAPAAKRLFSFFAAAAIIANHRNFCWFGCTGQNDTRCVRLWEMLHAGRMTANCLVISSFGTSHYSSLSCDALIMLHGWHWRKRNVSRRQWSVNFNDASFDTQNACM